MARKTMSMSFKNAIINLSDMSIVETSRDDSEEFDLMEVLKSWDGVEGISITIKQDSGLDLTIGDGE